MLFPDTNSDYYYHANGYIKSNADMRWDYTILSFTNTNDYANHNANFDKYGQSHANADSNSNGNF
uniref:Uncharacterized protein n=1 Tax=viral metagenome TaxID=1070528 RepID=A0A6M3J2T2_9ZZZZ